MYRPRQIRLSDYRTKVAMSNTCEYQSPRRKSYVVDAYKYIGTIFVTMVQSYALVNGGRWWQ